MKITILFPNIYTMVAVPFLMSLVLLGHCGKSMSESALWQYYISMIFASLAATAAAAPSAAVAADACWFRALPPGSSVIFDPRRAPGY